MLTPSPSAVPPVGVFLIAGCGADLLINICLTCLGLNFSPPPPNPFETVLRLIQEDHNRFFPGHIHAFYLEYIYFDRVSTSSDQHLLVLDHSKSREMCPGSSETLDIHWTFLTARSSCFGKEFADSESSVARQSPSRHHCAEASTGRLLGKCTERGSNFVWNGAGLGTLN